MRTRHANLKVVPGHCSGSVSPYSRVGGTVFPARRIQDGVRIKGTFSLVYETKRKDRKHKDNTRMCAAWKRGISAVRNEDC